MFNEALKQTLLFVELLLIFEKRPPDLAFTVSINSVDPDQTRSLLQDMKTATH